MPAPVTASAPEPDVAPVVDVRGLCKTYGSRRVLDGLELTAREGAVTAVLGPNGAGKTTAVEICEGLRARDAGEVRVLGLDPADRGDRARLRRLVGVMLQDGGMPSAPSAGRFLAHVGRLYDDPMPLPALVERLGLGDALRTPIRRLSGGQRARVALAAALTGRPRLAFLDEPTTGLDPQARHVVLDLVRELRADGVAVVLTSHAMEDVEALADHVVIIDGGRAIAAGSPADLVAGGETLTFDGPAGLDLDDLACALGPGLAVTEARTGHYVVRASGSSDGGDGAGGPRREIDARTIAAVAAWCASVNVHPDRLRTGRRSLEDVFLDLTGRSLR